MMNKIFYFTFTILGVLALMGVVSGLMLMVAEAGAGTMGVIFLISGFLGATIFFYISSKFKHRDEIQKTLKFLKTATSPEFKTGIQALENTLREKEEALRNNVEYFSEKDRFEPALVDIKDKKGWFYGLLRKYLKYRLEQCINKPPKRLNKESRKFLEGSIERQKQIIVNAEKLTKK